MSIKKIILLLSLVFGFCFTTSVNAETRLDKLQKELSSKEKSLSNLLGIMPEKYIPAFSTHFKA